MNEVEEPHSPLQDFVTHKYYESASGVLIIVNSVYLGWQTQFLAKQCIAEAAAGVPLSGLPDFCAWFGWGFCVLFSVELGLRWKAEGFIDFFKTAELWWNVLDVVVVGGSILEMILDFFAFVAGTEKSDALKNVSVLRVLRVVRVVRVARVIRVMKFFRELRMMIYSILGCLKNLMWVLVVLFMTFYVFGVGFCSGVTDTLATSEMWVSEDNEGLVEYFGTIDRAFLSLFMSMSGGNDWSQYYDALTALPPWYPVGFLMFIVFCLFAVVNIVTGVFVESALGSSIKDRDVIVHEELETKKQYLQSMEEIFDEMDEDHKGTISMAEFEDKLQDERVIAYFSVLKLDVSDARMLFQLIDLDNSDEIAIDEFLEGCYKLQGESRALDMKMLQFEVRFLKERFEEFSGSLEKALGTAKKPKEIKVKDQTTVKPPQIAWVGVSGSDVPSASPNVLGPYAWSVA